MACELYSKIGYPSLHDYKMAVKTQMLNKCPVTIGDIKIAEKIFGPDIAVLKGKTTRKRPEPVVTDYIKIPKEILDIHKEVVLAGDLCFIQKIPFFITISRNIKFTTVEHLDNRKATTILGAVDNVSQLYNSKEFVVTTMNMDKEFECL